MAKVKTAVVVKKSPTAAVAVNRDRFILRTIYKNTNYPLGFRLY